MHYKLKRDKLTNVDNMNPDYLQKIKVLLIRYREHLIRVHKGDKKYKVYPADIRAEYNRNINYHEYPKITTKIVIELLKEN